MDKSGIDAVGYASMLASDTDSKVRKLEDLILKMTKKIATLESDVIYLKNAIKGLQEREDTSE